MSRRLATARSVTALAATALALLLSACQNPSPRETALAEQATHDGLVQVDSGQLDQLWRKPGTTLAGYDRVRLDLTEITFRADWEPERQSSLYRMSPPDRDRIRSQMAESFQEVFRDELARGDVQLSEASGRDVLGVRAQIVDLYIFAPESFDEPGRVTRYSRESASMTLVAELYDSVTGEVLARAVKRERGMEKPWFERADSIRLNAESRRTFRRWAVLLRDALEQARQE